MARDKAKMQSEWKAKWEAARRAEEQVPNFTAPLPNSTNKQWHQWYAQFWPETQNLSRVSLFGICIISSQKLQPAAIFARVLGPGQSTDTKSD